MPSGFFSFFPDQGLGGTVGHPGSEAHLLYLQQLAKIGKTILLYLYKPKAEFVKGKLEELEKGGGQASPPL